MQDIQIGSVTIGEGKPVVTIAEVACQHGGAMANAKRLIDAAKESGADIVKFQLHVPEAEMVAGTIKFWGGTMDDVLKKAQFGTYEEHKGLKEYCAKVGIQYLCTPFSIAAADILEKVGVDGYKTGSGELTNLPMMRHLAKKGKPMIVSTGMCTMDEIADTVKVLEQEGANFALTHCLSEYPPVYEDMHLGVIQKLKEKFGILVGSSDHSPEIYSAIVAVALGATIIEKHFTLPDLNGPDDVVSLSPAQFKEMVRVIRGIEQATDSEKKLSEKELVTRAWAHHSVIAARDIKQGEILNSQNLVVKRPGTGIPSKYLDMLYSEKLIGKKAAKDLAFNTILQWVDVE